MEFVKGHEYIVDMGGQDLTIFAKVLLAILNTKSSANKDAKIVEVKTLVGTNNIYVTAEGDIGGWLELISEKKVEKHEKLICHIGIDTVEAVIEQGNIIIENKKLLDEVESLYDVHLVADNEF